MKRTELDRSPGFLVHDVARLMRRFFDRQVRDLGATRAQWFVLAHLVRKDGQTQSELAAELDMERAPVGRLLDRLEENAWIRRAADPSDRRVKRIFLTEKFDPLVEQMRDAVQVVYAKAFKGIPPERIEILLDILAQTKKNLTDERTVDGEPDAEPSDALIGIGRP